MVLHPVEGAYVDDRWRAQDVLVLAVCLGVLLVYFEYISGAHVRPSSKIGVRDFGWYPLLKSRWNNVSTLAM